MRAKHLPCQRKCENFPSFLVTALVVRVKFMATARVNMKNIFNVDKGTESQPL
jgi:hypothetical protein